MAELPKRYDNEQLNIKKPAQIHQCTTDRIHTTIHCPQSIQHRPTCGSHLVSLRRCLKAATRPTRPPTLLLFVEEKHHLESFLHLLRLETPHQPPQQPMSVNRPTTPLRRVSRGSISALSQSQRGGASSSSTPLSFLEGAMGNLADETSTLSTNLEDLASIHGALNTFNEGFSMFLYGLKVAAYCIEWSEVSVRLGCSYMLVWLCNLPNAWLTFTFNVSVRLHKRTTSSVLWREKVSIHVVLCQK